MEKRGDFGGGFGEWEVHHWLSMSLCPEGHNAELSERSDVGMREEREGGRLEGARIGWRGRGTGQGLCWAPARRCVANTRDGKGVAALPSRMCALGRRGEAAGGVRWWGGCDEAGDARGWQLQSAHALAQLLH